jgi:hypothetical protein
MLELGYDAGARRLCPLRRWSASNACGIVHGLS